MQFNLDTEHSFGVKLNTGRYWLLKIYPGSGCSGWALGQVPQDVAGQPTKLIYFKIHYGHNGDIITT